MTETMKSTTDTIKIRSKFEKALAELSEDKRDRIIAAIINFKNIGDDAACLRILWELTYDYIKGLKSIGLISIDATEEEIREFPEDFVKSFRNELRYQRKVSNPKFMQREISENCKEAYKALCSATDAIVAVIIYDICCKLCKNNDQNTINRALNLLASDKEQHFFGGIRSLHLKRDEAIYLKPYAILLHNLLNALYEEGNKQKKDTPFEGLTDMIALEEKKEEKVVSYESTEMSEKLEKKNIELIGNAITVSNIEADSDIFENFLNSYRKIVDAGYEPEQVIEKSEYIQAILDISKKLIG